MDLPALSTENIGLSVGVFLAAVFFGIRKYLLEYAKPPEPTAADVVVAGGTIADMSVFRDMLAAQQKLAAEVGGIREIMQRRIEAEEEAEEDNLRERLRDLERQLAAKPTRPRAPRRRQPKAS